MFIDEIEITISGGDGGDGRVAFFAGKNGPSGGDGGNGGAVYASIDKNLFNLNKYARVRSYHAPKGEPGDRNRRHGIGGADLTLYFPPGTSFVDTVTNHEVELSSENIPLLLCQGGMGGRGNDSFKTATYQTPRDFEFGKPGEKKIYKVILRLIADYGFIGLPNAGKSSLLNELTAAGVKTASYPFTTLEPNLGAMDGHIIADIPGLIEGASGGKGLGIKFLKHIEKVKLLLHCVASDSADMVKDYETINRELEQYSAVLMKKKQIVLLTKHDLLNDTEREEKLKILRKLNNNVLSISIHDLDSIEKLKQSLSCYIP